MKKSYRNLRQAIVCYEVYLCKIIHFLEKAVLLQEHNEYETLPV